MSAMETWQRPAADDINPDALEYLFEGTRGRVVEIPWVRAAREPEPVARKGIEQIRLESKVEVLLGQIDLLTSQLQLVNCELGYAKAVLDEREQGLKSLSEYRARAARAILGDVQNEMLRKKVVELEGQVAVLLGGNSFSLESDADSLRAPAGLSSVDMSRIARSGQKSFSFPLMPITYVLILALASMMLFAIFF